MSMAGSFRIDARQLSGFGAGLKRAQRDLGVQMRRELKPVRDEIRNESREMADSSKIARTVRASTVGTNSPEVRLRFTAGGKGVPEAYLRERGNKDRPAAATTFRHPVFPRPDEGRDEWTWVEQDKHPFMWPVIVARRERASTALKAAIGAVWSHTGPSEV